jgi:hypothetical protein
VDPRQPEDRHHGVADELLDRAPVPLGDGLQMVEVSVQDPSVDLRVVPLTGGCRPDDVGEQDRDDLAGLLVDRRQRTTAGETEPGPLRIRLAALPAWLHGSVAYRRDRRREPASTTRARAQGHEGGQSA